MNQRNIWSWLVLFFAQSIFASEQGNQNWKVSFFKCYMNECSSLGSPTHEGVAKALQSSFDQAARTASEQEAELVSSVRGQVEYFVSLQDEKEKQQELSKCKEGMKLAQSSWARIAPDSVKAHFFVKEFAQAAADRTNK